MGWFETFTRSFLDFQAMAEVLPNMIRVGLKNTLILAAASTFFGTLIGILLAVMGISDNRPLKLVARVYTDIFRGLPAIVTILIIGQGFARLGRDLFGPSPYPLGILALSLIAGAYIGEIFRAGIQSVERGQLDATRTLGMTYGQGMRLVVIPQGIRRVLPALVNQFIGNVKDSSLVYFLGLLASEREIVPCRPGPRRADRQSVAAAAGRHILSRHHRAADPSRELHRRPHARRQAYCRGAERTDGSCRACRSRCSGRQLEATAAVSKQFKGGSIEVKHIDMAYGAIQVLHDVSLKVEPGTVTCLIGPSGSGKSTLLRCLNRLVECRAGDILLDGESIYKQTPDQLRRRVGMVFQQFNLFPDRSALSNITLALRKVKGMSRERGRGRRRGETA